MTVIYTLTTKFIGLIGQPNSPPQGNLLYKDDKVVTIRAVDPLPKINVQQEATGNLKGIFNKSAGTCILSGQMQSENVMVGQFYHFRLLINQSQSQKETAMIRIVLNRTIKCTGRTVAGQPKDFTDKQPVMMVERPIKIATKVPEVVGENLSLKMTRFKDIDIEKRRALMLVDIETGLQMPIALKSAQHDVLPTMKTELINVTY